MTAIRNNDWYDLNEQRAWPLDDAATGVDDDGAFLPHGVLVDLALRFPRALGTRAFLTACTVTDSLVTIVLAIAGPGDPVPAAAVSLARPLDRYRPYPLEPLAAGVGGWAVFGAGAEEPYRGRFATAAQGLVLPRCARGYRDLPLSGLAKPFAAATLAGVVELRAGNDLEVAAGAIVLGDAEVPAATIGLRPSPGRDVFTLYAGPCRGRPESGNCSRPAVETINGVAPDCAGELTLHFRNVLVRPLQGGGGAVLDLGLGLGAACAASRLPDEDGTLPGTYADPCAVSSSSLGEE